MSQENTKNQGGSPAPHLATKGSFTPRHTEAHQWTDLPADFLAKLKEIFVRQFDFEAQEGEFIAEGRIYPKEAMIRIGYLQKGRLKQINFEASIDLNEPTAGAGISDEDGIAARKSEVMDQIYTCIDSLGSLMEEYFQLGDDEDFKLPFHWTALEFEGETLYVQQSSINSRLEDEADRLLGLTDDALLHQLPENEDALTKAEIDAELAFDVQEELRKRAESEQQIQ